MGPFDIQDASHAWKHGRSVGEVKEYGDDISYVSEGEDSGQEGGNSGLNVYIHAADEI
jgi:hypothetical protein